MFFFLSKVLDVFLSPLSWALGLVIASAFVERRRLARGLALGGVFVLWFFATGCVSGQLQRTLEAPPTKTLRADVSYDAVIVLGGLVDDDATDAWGMPAYNDNVERLLVAYDLLRTDRAKFAILSSGVGHIGSGTPEADILLEQLAAWGIPRERLIAERTSRNTHENAVESQRVVVARAFHDIVMITSAFHMPRAVGCFRKIGLSVDALPVDYRSSPARFNLQELFPRAGGLHTSAHAFHEFAGRGIYRLRGYSELALLCHLAVGLSLPVAR